jgi:hypothetical protein
LRGAAREERNSQIWEQYRAGESIAALSVAFDLSEQFIEDVVRRERRYLEGLQRRARRQALYPDTGLPEDAGLVGGSSTFGSDTLLLDILLEQRRQQLEGG